MNVDSSCGTGPDGIVPSGIEQEDQGTKTLRIMLLGKCGVGKSSSGNTILGRQVFKSDMELKRVTHYCEKESGTVKDVPVSVIDTPGLFETKRNKEAIMREILKCVKLQEPGPHVFVLVVPVGRLTQEDQDTNMLIEAMFGPRVWDYTIVLFTHGDRLEGKTINDVITKSEDNLRDFIRKCSGGFHVFNNKDPQDQDQVTSFVAKIQTLLALNGGRHYETALYPTEERKIREKQESILVERNTENSWREEKLRDKYKGQELEEKKKELWRKEEDKARGDAENYIRKPSYIQVLCYFLGGIAVICLVFLLTSLCLQKQNQNQSSVIVIVQPSTTKLNLAAHETNNRIKKVQKTCRKKTVPYGAKLQKTLRKNCTVFGGEQVYLQD